MDVAYASISIAALAALYNGIGPMPIFEAMELMLMMRPPRGMLGTTAWIMYSAVNTLTAKTFSTVWVEACNHGSVLLPPALLT